MKRLILLVWCVLPHLGFADGASFFDENESVFEAEFSLSPTALATNRLDLGQFIMTNGSSWVTESFSLRGVPLPTSLKLDTAAVRAFAFVAESTNGTVFANVFVRQYNTAGAAYSNMLKSAVANSIPVEMTIARHRLNSNISDLCLERFALGVDKSQVPPTSVMILRNNLSLVASGRNMTNLVETASAVFDQIVESASVLDE